MKLIAHRGLTNGPDNALENTIAAIDLAIEHGYDVEVDIWKIQDKIYLGHDEPKESIDLEFLLRPQIWAHAKNLQALQYMLENNVHCFGMKMINTQLPVKVIFGLIQDRI